MASKRRVSHNKSKRERQRERENRRRKSRAIEAELRSPTLPFLQARQDRNRQWLKSRADRFSQLLAASFKSSFHGNDLVSRGTLTAVQRDELLHQAEEAAPGIAVEIRNLMVQLRELVSDADPSWLLGLSSFHNVYGRWGEYFEPSHEGRETHVEILSGILASQPVTGSTEREAATFAKIEELLIELEQVSWLYNLARAAAQVTTGAARSLEAQFRSTQYWMNMRGDAYVEHARDLALRLYGRADGWLRKNYGFSGRDLVTTAESIRMVLERRVNDAIHELRTLPLAQEIAAAARSQDELTDEDKALFGAKVLSLIGEGERTIVSAIKFSEADVLDCCPDGLENPLAISSILQALSFEIGERSSEDYEGPFDPTPLRDTPLVRVNGAYMLPVPGHLLRSLPNLLERQLLARYPRFSKMRAEVVDDLSLELLQAALPGADAGSRLKYRFDDGEGEQEYEVDGLVVFESWVLVIEGKATELSMQARRGDLARATRDLKRAIGDAWEQADRARRYILSSGAASFHSDTKSIAIDSDNVRKVLLINPTFHVLSDFVFQEPGLRELGVLPPGVWAWSVYINDLRVICDLITTPAELLHYVEWRGTLNVGERILAVDELDIFGAYLFGDVRRLSSTEDHMFLGNSTTDFDAYYFGLSGDGPPREKPHRVLGPFLEAELVRLGTQRPDGWVDTSLAVLDMTLEEAALTEVALTKWAIEHFARGRTEPMVVEKGGVVVMAVAGARTELSIAIPRDGAERIFIGARVVGGRTRIVVARRLSGD